MATPKKVSPNIPPITDTNAWPKVPGVNTSVEQETTQTAQEVLPTPQVLQHQTVQVPQQTNFTDPQQLLSMLLDQYRLEIVSDPQLLAVSDGSFILKPSYKVRYRNG